MTQQQVDSLIHHYMDLALRAEARRDTCVYESREYWRHHDIAIGWHGLAESLMPRSSRMIEDTSARRSLTRRCAWCDRHLGGPPPALNHPETHGICLCCADKMLEESKR